MYIVDFQGIKNKADNEIIERLREFQDYYEYCFIHDYEEKYIDIKFLGWNLILIRIISSVIEI